MKILFVADGRSPTAINWMRYFVDKGDEVHLASLYTCSPELALKSLHLLPFPLGGVDTSKGSGAGLIKKIVPPSIRTRIRQSLVPSRIQQSSDALKTVIAEIKPDIIHALRIPYEGMTAALADPEMPLLVSVWGNDFTLHADSNRRMRDLTRQTMERVDALLADCLDCAHTS